MEPLAKWGGYKLRKKAPAGRQRYTEKRPTRQQRHAERTPPRRRRYEEYTARGFGEGHATLLLGNNTGHKEECILRREVKARGGAQRKNQESHLQKPAPARLPVRGSCRCWSRCLRVALASRRRLFSPGVDRPETETAGETPALRGEEAGAVSRTRERNVSKGATKSVIEMNTGCGGRLVSRATRN